MQRFFLWKCIPCCFLKIEWFKDSEKSSHISHFHFMIFSILTWQIFCKIIQAIYFFVHLFLFVTIFVFLMLFSATKTVMIDCKILSKQSLLFKATIFVDDNGIFCNQQLIWDCILYIFCTLTWCGITYWRWIVQTSYVTLHSESPYGNN